MALAVVVGLAPAGRVLAATEPTGSSVALHSQEGHFVGQGRHRMFHDGNASIRVSTWPVGVAVALEGGTSGESFGLTFRPPRGQRLAPGSYVVPRGISTDGPDLDVGGNARGCASHGRFTVHDVRYDAAGAVDRLHLTFEHHCSGAGLSPVPALFGELRWTADPAPPVLLAARHLWFPDVHPHTTGVTAPVWLTAHEPVTLTEAALAGDHPEDFAVRVDGCAGRRLQPGQTCAVWVSAQPVEPGPRHAALEVSDTTGRVHRTALDVTAIPGRTRIELDSEPGDPAGRGASLRFDVRNARITLPGGTRSWVRVVAEAPDGGAWVAQLEAVGEETLLRGTYEGATTAGRPGWRTEPRLLVIPDPWPDGCGPVRGRFTVTHIRHDPQTGVPLQLGATFEQRCEGREAALRGTVEYRVPGTPQHVPPPVTGAAVRAVDGGATVTWAHPPGSGARRAVVRTIPGPRGVDHPNAGVLVTSGEDPSAHLDGVASDEVRTFSIFPVGLDGEVGPARHVTLNGPPPAPPPPAPTPTPTPTPTPAPPDVRRLAGGDRIATAVAASQDRFAAGTVTTVVLARSDGYVDALAGTPLAAHVGGPLLLTPPGRLAPAAAAELDRVLRALPPPTPQVLVLGGPAAIAEEVLHELRARGHRPLRVAGRDRFATAVAVADRLGEPSALVLASGLDHPDALAAGAAAAATGGAVLLSAGEEPAPATVAHLDRVDPRVLVAVGGPAARAHPDAEPIAGRDRYDTAVRVARRFFPDGARAVGVARGDAFADALAGGAHIAGAPGPLLLTAPDRLPAAAAAHLCRSAADVVVYGGSGAVGDRAVEAIRGAVAGRGC